MTFLSELKPLSILLIVAGAIVAAGICVLTVFLFYRNKLKREVREVDRKFQFLHALLIGQDAQYVKRLEIISRTNLLYVDTHTKFLKKFKEIRDRFDSRAQGSVNNLKDTLSDRKFKILKAAIATTKEIVNSYEKEVNALNDDLLKVVRPEEECRQSVLSYKESLRRIKQDYYTKQSDLLLVSDSFTEVFAMIEKLFGDFENLVDSAQYDEANLILPKIDTILHELTVSLQELPNLCALVSNIIPEKLLSLENAYETMVHDDYPLHHLGVKQTIREINIELDSLTKKVKHFEIRGVSERLEEIVSSIDEFSTFFEEEKVARNEFELNYESVYLTVNTIERRFIKLCNAIPEVSNIFIINDFHKGKINDIQNDINKLGASKRSLDTFIHSAMKTPYSILVSKMNELNDSSKLIIVGLDEFNSYLLSLKDDAEKAFSLIHSLFDKAKIAEQQIHEMRTDKITEKYTPQIEHFYELLNSLNEYLNKSPIDVEIVNTLAGEVKQISDELFGDGLISQDFNMMVLAENTILLANKDRQHLSEVNQSLEQAETFFANGEFEQAYIISGNVLSKTSANEGK